MQNLIKSELRYRRLFEAAQDGILIIDAETGMIDDVNPFLIKMLGYSLEEFVQRRLWEVGAFKDIEANQSAFEELQKQEYIRYENLPLKAKDGHLVQVEFVSNVYLVNEQKVIQCNIRDITERVRAQDALAISEALLRAQSVRDHQTGLFNRRYMEEVLDQEISRAVRKRLPLGIIMLDVDDFKKINDTWGHAAGDTILVDMGRMLLGNVREGDVPCRYGGDEFVIVMPETSFNMTLDRAKQLCENTRHFKPVFEGQPWPVTLSIGVAAYAENGILSAAILKAADDALYRAKHEGRNRVVSAG